LLEAEFHLSLEYQVESFETSASKINTNNSRLLVSSSVCRSTSPRWPLLSATVEL